MSKNLDKKNCQQNYIRSLCGELFEIFPDINFETKCLKKITQEKFWTITILYVLKCSKYYLIYILGYFVPKKSGQKYFELYQVFMHYLLCQNVPILPNWLNTTDALKALLSKNWFDFFCYISWHAKIPPSSKMLRDKH